MIDNNCLIHLIRAHIFSRRQYLRAENLLGQITSYRADDLLGQKMPWGRKHLRAYNVSGQTMSWGRKPHRADNIEKNVSWLTTPSQGR